MGTEEEVGRTDRDGEQGARKNRGKVGNNKGTWRGEEGRERETRRNKE